MAFRYGTKFRRLFAQAVSADPKDECALIERVLPPGEGGKRRLRLRTLADCDVAPRAIVAAWLADEITAEEANDLLQRVEKAQQGQEPLWSRPEDDPLAASIRAWGAAADEKDERETTLREEARTLGRCGAANEPGPLKRDYDASAGAAAAAARRGNSRRW